MEREKAIKINLQCRWIYGMACKLATQKYDEAKYTHFLFKFPSTIFFFRNAVDWQWMRRNGKKLSISKSSTRAEIITFKLAIFLFMIKYEFEMSAWKIWERNSTPSSIYLCSLLLIFISRIFNTFHSLAVSGLAKKIHESLMDLLWWVFFYLQPYPWMF